MANLSSPYLLLTFLFSLITTIVGIMIFSKHIPEGKDMERYGLSRNILACAYLILGIPGYLKIFILAGNTSLALIRAFTLFSAFFQALLFTFTLLVLIQPLYVTWKRVFIQLGFVLLLNIFLFIFLFHLSDNLYPYIFYTALVIYIGQLINYVSLFRKKYTQCIKQLQDYYNEIEDRRLHWVKVYFYMALSIGILVLISTHLPLFYCTFLFVIYIVFYVFFAIKYNNYPTKFGYIVAAVSSDVTEDYQVVLTPDTYEESQVLPLSQEEMKLKQAIDIWVQEKKYVENDISRDDIASSLGTDRIFLSNFFCNRMQIEFRVWRTNLRIEEAKNLLLEYPDLSVSCIGRKVGIYDRSNFQKHFFDLVGMSPKEWRTKNLRN